MLCWLADDRNLQSEEIVSNFKITNDFSAVLDECSSLIDVVYLVKDLKHWCLSTVTKILNN